MIKMLNKMIKKSYIALSILSIILLNNNIMSMENSNQYSKYNQDSTENNKDNRDNQGSANIVNVLPIEILSMIIEKNMMTHIDNWQDIFELNNIIKNMSKEIATFDCLCKAFNDMKPHLISIRDNLVDKKFKILKDKICDEFAALSEEKRRDTLIKLVEQLNRAPMCYDIGGFNASEIYDVAKALIFNSYCDIEDHLIIDAANAVFIWAEIHGNRPIIDVLLKSGVKLLEYNEDGLPDESVLLDIMENCDENGILPADYCALAAAACQEDKTMADFLISKGSNIGQAFAFSASAGYINAVKYFISTKSHLIDKDEISWALRRAIGYRRTKAVKLILSSDIMKKNNQDNRDNQYTTSIVKDINGGSPLISLIKFREKDGIKEGWRKLYTKGIIQLLMDKEVDVDTKDDNNKSALMWVAELGDVEIVTLLIKSGVNIKAQDKNGDTALIYALKSGQQEIVKLLIANGANIADDLLTAAKNGYRDVVNTIINSGVSINTHDIFGRTALMFAVSNNHIDVVRLLLIKKIDVNAKNVHGCNALMLAIESGNMDMVKLLINNGADINSKDSMGNSVLMMAVRFCNTDLVQLLISKKVDTQCANNYGESALFFAIEFANKDIVDMILESDPEYISFMPF